tara:strand:- start:567 stop:989 length:423 start_codon:yes stop_codon:yes gene_type:complete
MLDQKEAKPSSPAAPASAEARKVKVQLQNDTNQDFRVVKSLVTQGPWSPLPASPQPPEKGVITGPAAKSEWSMVGAPIGKTAIGKTEFISDLGYLSVVWRWRSNGIFDHDIRTSGNLSASTSVEGPWSKEPQLTVVVSQA